jgi:hypothetical protein
MAIIIPNSFNSYGSVAGGTGTAVSGAGFVSARTGAGVYTLTLDEPVDSTECAILVSRRGAAAGADETFSVEHTSDTVKTVTCTAAGVATDSDFDFAVLRCPG